MINELLDYLYNKPELKAEVDEYLDDGYKIDAIKLLRHEVLTYHKSMKYTLRNLSDAIDTYYNRFLLSKKLNKLVIRIEEWATANDWGHPRNYDKVDFLPNRDFHADWKLVDKHIGFVFDKLHWSPSHSEYKEYNRMWKKYTRGVKKST